MQYFDASINDGSKKLRLVGFDGQSHLELAAFVKQKTPVKATGCNIRKSRNDDYEVHINRSTRLSASSRKINFESTSPCQIVMSNLQDTEVGQLVNVTASILSIAPPRVVATGTVEEITIGDDTEDGVMSVWDENVDKFSTSMMYRFQNLHVRSYRNEITLMYGRTSLCDLANGAENLNIESDDSLETIQDVTIVGLQSI